MASTIHLRQYCVLFYLLTMCFLKTMPLMRFSNVRCTTFDARLSEVADCRLIALKRNLKVISVKIKSYDLPWSKSIFMIVQFWKKTNGYTKFKKDMKIDICEYMQRKNNIIMNSILNVFHNYTNMNHSCPYDHDLTIEKVQLEDSALRWLPFPAGDYAFYVQWMLHSVKRFQIDFYFSFAENPK